MRYFTLALVFITSISLHAQDVIDQVSISYDGITHLAVEGSFAKVDIKGERGSKLQFDGEITGHSGKGTIEIKYEKTGTRLHVWINRPSRGINWGRNLNGLLRFTVPDNIELDIDNSSGAVYVDGINARVCRLEASSGRVNARNITAETSLETSSGRIEATNINGNLQTHSSSGGQHLEDVTGNIESVASSGRISLDHVKGRLHLRTSSGGITGEAITLTGDSKFRCTSGSVRMNLANDVKSYTYDCSASSGSIYIGDDKVGKNAYYKYGDIVIRGETTSGSQKYQSY